MTPEAVTYYKRMAAAHADDPVTGRCPKCGTRRCMDYVTAVLKLGDAGYRVDER